MIVIHLLSNHTIPALAAPKSFLLATEDWNISPKHTPTPLILGSVQEQGNGGFLVASATYLIETYFMITEWIMGSTCWHYTVHTDCTNGLSVGSDYGSYHK